MKTLTKLAAASLLALSAITPALAAEENTLIERSAYGTNVNAQYVRHNGAQAHRAIDAFAFAPADAAAYSTQDFGIESQR